MSRFKIVGIMALIAFATGILLVGNAVAGEKFKWRAEWNTGKPAVFNVPGEEGQIIGLREDKGILKVLEGSKVMDGMAGVHVGYSEVNTKTGEGVGHGRILFTDQDGHKMYWSWEGKGEKGKWSLLMNFLRGTGKFDGFKGKAMVSTTSVSPNQFYADWEGEME